MTGASESPPTLSDSQKTVLTYIYEWCLHEGHYALGDAIFVNRPALDADLRERSDFTLEMQSLETIVALTAMSLAELERSDLAMMLRALGLMRDASAGALSSADLELAVRTEHVLRVLRERTADDGSIDWAAATTALLAAFPSYREEKRRTRHETRAPDRGDALYHRACKLEKLIASAEKRDFAPVDAFLEANPFEATYVLFHQEANRAAEIWRASKPPPRLHRLLAHVRDAREPGHAGQPRSPRLSQPSAPPPPKASGAPSPPRALGARTPNAFAHAAPRDAAAPHTAPACRATTPGRPRDPSPSAHRTAPRDDGPPPRAQTTPSRKQPVTPVRAADTPVSVRASPFSPPRASNPSVARARSRSPAARVHACPQREDGIDSLDGEGVDGISSPGSGHPVARRDAPSPARGAAAARADTSRAHALHPTGRAGPPGIGVHQPAAVARRNKRKAFSNDEVRPRAHLPRVPSRALGRAATGVGGGGGGGAAQSPHFGPHRAHRGRSARSGLRSQMAAISEGCDMFKDTSRLWKQIKEWAGPRLAGACGAAAGRLRTARSAGSR